jgi:hypothetical protein
MWEWGTVAARRLPEATHAPVGTVSTAMSDFFILMALMAAMLPRSMTSLRFCDGGPLGRGPLYLRIYLSASDDLWLLRSG